MTKNEIQNLVQKQLVAYNNRNINDFCSCFHPEVKAYSLLLGTLNVEGIEKFRSGYKNLFDSNPSLHCEIKSRIVLGESVIDEEWVTGAARYPDGLHACAVYAFRDGLIDRIWFTR